MDLPVTIYRGKTNSYSSKTTTFITTLVPWIVSCYLSLSHISIIFSPTLLWGHRPKYILGLRPYLRRLSGPRIDQ